MSRANLSPMVRDHLVGVSPRHRCYFLLGRRLVAKPRLWRRSRRIRALYPEASRSLVDLSAGEGWFCLHAGQRLGATRVLGVGLDEPDLAACRAVRDHLDLRAVDFRALGLRQVHGSLGELGGPFDVALMIDLYHHLYFGSWRGDGDFESHTEIFELLRGITRRALIFSDHTEVEHLPSHLQAVARERGRAESFTGRQIREAAAEFFEITDHGPLGGQRLWRLTPR